MSYFGAELKAGFVGSDFLLLELTDNPGIQGNPVNSGAANIPLVACIHHPKGDVKKISLDFDPPVISGNFWLIDQWDDGLVQHSSSGAPLFDANHTIIGQLKGGDENIDCTSSGGSLVDNNTFGRVGVSWTGGGTDDSRLSSWLGSGFPPDVHDFRTVNGPKILCAGESGRFCLDPYISLPSGVVNWSVSPANWFDSPASGNKTCADITVKNSFAGSGRATITFIGAIPYGICGSVQDTISYDFWVGKPDFVLDAEPLTMCPRDRGIATIYSHGGLVNTSINWSFTGAISGIGSVGIGKYSANFPGYGSICVTATNKCGSTTKCLTIQVDDCGPGGGRRFSIIPNPTGGTTLIALDPERYAMNSKKTVKVMDSYSKVLLQRSITGFDVELDMSFLNPGVYFITISDEQSKSSQKFIKL